MNYLSAILSFSLLHCLKSTLASMWQELVAPHFTMLLVVEMLSVVKYVVLVRVLFNCLVNSFNCVLTRICSLQLLIARGACITALNASGCDFQLLPHGK